MAPVFRLQKMMKPSLVGCCCCFVLLVLCQINQLNAQFSFSLPGNWGTGKRTAAAATTNTFGYMTPRKWNNAISDRTKFEEECSKFDYDTMTQVYARIQVSPSISQF